MLTSVPVAVTPKVSIEFANEAIANGWEETYQPGASGGFASPSKAFDHLSESPNTMAYGRYS